MKRTVHKVQLPSDFAQRLLDNQIELKLSQTPSKQVICNLIQLYTYGVEYYESIRSYKYLYFQKKMNQLFTSGTTIQAINKSENQNQQAVSPVKKKMNSPVQQQKIEALQIKQKQHKMLNQIMQKTNYSITGHQAKQILNNTDKKMMNVEKVINDQVQSQNKSLQQKLRQRKAKTLIAKSLSSIQLFQTETRDSLFDSDKKKTTLNNKGIKEPLVVDFGSLINQNDESDQQDQQVVKNKRKLSVVGKRVMSTQNLHDINDQL